MGYSGLNQEQVVAMPCNLVRMLKVGVPRDVPNFSRVQVQEEELCQPVVWMTNAAMMPFRLVLPKDDDFRLNLHVERREMTKSNRSVAQRILDVEVEANLTGGTTCWRHQYGAPLRSWRYERAARQRVACFEASYQRQNELTKQDTKQTAADHLQAENEPSESSSLHAEQDVN